MRKDDIKFPLNSTQQNDYEYLYIFRTFYERFQKYSVLYGIIVEK